MLRRFPFAACSACYYLFGRVFSDLTIPCNYCYKGGKSLLLQRALKALLCLRMQVAFFTKYLARALSSSFKREYSWWSSIELGKRFVLILFIVAFPANSVCAFKEC